MVPPPVIRADSIGSRDFTDAEQVPSGTGSIGALFLAGNAKKLTITSDSVLETGDIDFAYRILLEFNALLSTNNSVIACKAGSSTTAAQVAWSLYLDGNNQLTFRVSTGAAITNFTIPSSSLNLQTNTLYDVIFGHDATHNKLYIFVTSELGGQQYFEQSYSSGVSTGATRPLNIGGDGVAGRYSSIVVYDFFYLKNYILDSDDVTHLWSEGSPSTDPFGLAPVDPGSPPLSYSVSSDEDFRTALDAEISPDSKLIEISSDITLGTPLIKTSLSSFHLTGEGVNPTPSISWSGESDSHLLLFPDSRDQPGPYEIDNLILSGYSTTPSDDGAIGIQGQTERVSIHNVGFYRNPGTALHLVKGSQTLAPKPLRYIVVHNNNFLNPPDTNGAQYRAFNVQQYDGDDAYKYVYHILYYQNLMSYMHFRAPQVMAGDGEAMDVVGVSIINNVMYSPYGVVGAMGCGQRAVVDFRSNLVIIPGDSPAEFSAKIIIWSNQSMLI